MVMGKRPRTGVGLPGRGSVSSAAARELEITRSLQARAPSVPPAARPAVALVPVPTPSSSYPAARRGSLAAALRAASARAACKLELDALPISMPVAGVLLRFAEERIGKPSRLL